MITGLAARCSGAAALAERLPFPSSEKQQRERARASKPSESAEFPAAVSRLQRGFSFIRPNKNARQGQGTGTCRGPLQRPPRAHSRSLGVWGVMMVSLTPVEVKFERSAACGVVSRSSGPRTRPGSRRAQPVGFRLALDSSLRTRGAKLLFFGVLPPNPTANPA